MSLPRDIGHAQPQRRWGTEVNISARSQASPAGLGRRTPRGPRQFHRWCDEHRLELLEVPPSPPPGGKGALGYGPGAPQPNSARRESDQPIEARPGIGVLPPLAGRLSARAVTRRTAHEGSRLPHRRAPRGGATSPPPPRPPEPSSQTPTQPPPPTQAR